MSWYALHVRSCAESLVTAALDTLGVESYFPTSSGPKRAGRKAVFPGYVFASFALEERRPVVSIPQVVRILGIGSSPVEVDEGELLAVRQMVSSPLAIAPHHFMRCGERARVLYGPLQGLEGFVVRLKGSVRLVVSIECMGRSIQVELDARQVAPISGSPDESSMNPTKLYDQKHFGKGQSSAAARRHSVAKTGRDLPSNRCGCSRVISDNKTHCASCAAPAVQAA